MSHTKLEGVGDLSIDGAFWSPDLAPVPFESRTWGLKDVTVLWVALSACIPTYMLASSLIEEGMNWSQAVVTIFLGNLIVLVPMVLNAHAGTKYGIPFPVFCRASFGLRGANIPAILRALVACGWFGIQCWIGGAAIYESLLVYFPGFRDAWVLPYLQLNVVEVLCFLGFWSLNQLIIWRGIDSVRLLLNLKAPLLILMGLSLLAWAYRAAGGWGPILSQGSVFDPGRAKEGKFFEFFFPALTANVGFWATLSLNIPDFTRYVRRQRDQVIGQALGLPMTMGLFSFIGVAVTSATVVIYGAPIWDPVQLMSKFSHPLWHAVGLFGICVATLATNLAANVVGPANDFANLWPRKISFRTGALLTGIVGILIQPWHLVEDPSGYIFKWLVAYSALLGAVGGVMIADYYSVRRTKLDVEALFRRNGVYWFTHGFHITALIALLAGICPCLPGFLATLEVLETSPFWTELYHYAWFISFAISFIVYLALTFAWRPPVDDGDLDNLVSAPRPSSLGS